MKSSILILFNLILVMSLNGQTLIENTGFPLKDGKICYQDVVQVDSISSKQLNLNAKEWVVSTFKSARNVIQLDSEEKLIVRAFFEKEGNSAAVNRKFWFTLKIEFKESRYRYTLHELTYEADIQVMEVGSYVEKPMEVWLKYPNYKSRSKQEKAKKSVDKLASELDYKYKEIIANLDQAIKKQSNDTGDW